MPNIAITPKFTPFTYEELARPLVEATQYQMALEDQYNNLAMKAAELDYLEDSDDEAWQAVKNYEQGLRDAAGALMSKGLTPQSRQDLYNLRTRYQSEISPINKYVAWRQAQDKTRQEIMAKDPTYRWEVPLDQVKYNTWRDNPDMLFRGLSGDALAKMAQTSIQHITKRWRTDPEFKALKGKAGLEDYVQKLEEYGMSVEDMLNLSEAIANRNDLTEEEKKAINNKMAEAGVLVREQVINSTDIPQWSNYKDLETPDSPLSMWVDNNIKRGLWAGIGEQKDQLIHNANTEGKTGQGTPTEIQEANHKWGWLTGNKNATFLPSLKDAIWVGNEFKKGFNNFIDYTNKLANTKTGLNYQIQYALPFNLTTSGFNDFLGKNIDLSGNGLGNALKTFGFATNATFDDGASFDFTGDAIRKQYRDYIDSELEKKDSKVIRRVEGNDGDNTEKFAHKVHVPAIVALTKQLEAAGDNKEKRNIILTKYASMPLDRLEEIEIIDGDKYKTDYSVSDISNLLGGDSVSAGKISNAYKTLSEFMDNNGATDDAAAFAVHKYEGNKDQVKQMLITRYSDDRKSGTTEMNTYDYVWNEDKQDFDLVRKDDGLPFDDLKEADDVTIEYTPRGLLFKVNIGGEIYYTKYTMSGDNKKTVNRLLKEISTEITNFKNNIIKNTPEEEWSDAQIKAYNILQSQISAKYSAIDGVIANDLRRIKAEEEKR